MPSRLHLPPPLAQAHTESPEPHLLADVSLPSTRKALWSCLFAAGVGTGLFGAGLHVADGGAQPPLLIAPMVGNLDDCLLQDAVSAKLPLVFRPRPASCNGPEGSAAELLGQTLQPLALKGHAHAQPALALGYTLNVPLLRMLDVSPASATADAQSATGAPSDWRINPERIARYVRTLEQTEQPALLYLFATHFGVNSAAEAALAQDPANLAHSQQGVLPVDTYLDYQIYPWSVASPNNGITQVRLSVVREVARQICASPKAQAKLVGVSLLGEVHQLYPKFETGMGFESPYVVGDYSPASVQAFRRHLAQRFGSVDALNARLGSAFSSWDEVQPPSKNIRHDRLTNFFEHIDAFAHGRVPISGWVRVPAVDSDALPLSRSLAKRPWVRVLLNGAPVARVQASLSRQDVAQAHPLWRTADVGWRHDLAFDALPAGRHRVDVLLEWPSAQAGGEMQFSALATRHIHVMGPEQAAPMPQAMVQALPDLLPMPSDVSAYVDWPRESMDVYFNPLAVLWHAFRGQQVTRYLASVRTVLAQTCLAQVPSYVHQLYPHGNPGWDATRYALDQSLQSHSEWRVGVSLYGESAYGDRVGQFARDMRWSSYGITEFHPMRPMTGPQLGQVFAMHRAQGARFLSFFMEAHVLGSMPERMHNAFSFDENNDEMNGAALYRAVHDVMQGHATWGQGGQP